MISSVEAALCSQVGGDPSPAQILLIQRMAVKAVRCALAERQLLAQGGLSEFLENMYLKWQRELRLDLQVLGLHRAPRAVQALEDYIKEKTGGNGNP